MKKFICGLFVCSIALVLSGCGKGDKLTCTMEEDGNKSEVVLTFKDSKVSKAETSITFENEEYAQLMYGIMSADDTVDAKIDGKKVTVSLNSDEIDSEFGEEADKEEIKKTFEDQGYTCK